MAGAGAAPATSPPIKLLWWTGDGLYLLAKRLERGRDVLKALLLAAEQTVRERDAVIAARDEVVSGLRAQLTTTEVEIEHRR